GPCHTQSYAGGMTTTAPRKSAGYGPDDLLWARDTFGAAHIEIDPWGNLIVPPPSPTHERAIAALARILILALDGTTACVCFNLGSYARDGSGYLNVPDVTVLRTDRMVDDDWHLLETPLLIVEVSSPSTRD